MYDYQDKLSPKFTNEHPFNRKCLYCSSDLEFEKVKKISKVSFKAFYKEFLSYVVGMKEFHGRFEKNYFQINHSMNYEGSHIKRCLQCGWWTSYDEYWVSAPWQIWQVFYGITAVIKNVDLNDLSVPNLDIRNYLVRNYNARFQVNPRKFEDLVSSVFRDLGFQVLCTPYSHDGGIDILLEKGSDFSAVQVKRTKNAIKLEQVRSFLGALTLQGIEKGIYVSTAEFQRGCYDIARSCSIGLFGGNKFYETLLEAQILKYSDIVLPNLNDENLHYCGCFTMNSL